MDIKLCRSCGCEHLEDYDLCQWCSDERQRELERRLREDDGARGLAVIASAALYGERGRPGPAWKIC